MILGSIILGCGCQYDVLLYTIALRGKHHLPRLILERIAHPPAGVAPVHQPHFRLKCYGHVIDVVVHLNALGSIIRHSGGIELLALLVTRSQRRRQLILHALLHVGLAFGVEDVSLLAFVILKLGLKQRTGPLSHRCHLPRDVVAFVGDKPTCNGRGNARQNQANSRRVYGLADIDAANLLRKLA